MAKKRTTLVKNFQEIVDSGDLEAFKQVFEKCEINATDGWYKETALHFYGLTEEMICWFVDNGGDINGTNRYNKTALHKMAFAHRNCNLDIYIKLGADVNAKDGSGNTPLHFAAGGAFNPRNVQVLLDNGADPLIKNDEGKTPLDYAISRAVGIYIAPLYEIVQILLPYKPEITDEMRRNIEKMGKDFEFYRADFNKEFLPQTEEALEKLYEIFDVKPAEKRHINDGTEKITVKANTWGKQFDELWQMLVPGYGNALSVQGEVIRICGKVTREIWDNGACNWSREYKKLPQALPKYCAMGKQLTESDYKELSELAKGISANSDIAELDRLSELVVKWVLQNPMPIKLDKVDYDI